MQRKSFLRKITDTVRTIISLALEEYRVIFHDSGVFIIFIAATLIYPLLYGYIYKNELLRNVPVAVVDNSNSQRSRNFIRQLNATPEINIVATYANVDEAKQAFQRHTIHGIVYISKDFDDKINQHEQATVSIYSDMSSFLYYRSMMIACNYTALKIGKNIQIERANAEGVVGEQAEINVQPIQYEENIFYNPGTGFASFLMPALLILMIHQTLFFGIGMLAGTAREENKFHLLVPQDNMHSSLYKVILGKTLCYFTLYMVVSAYILGFAPRLFNLPHIGNPNDLILFVIPFLFATIFFSMTISVFVKNRETGLVTFLFFSVILLFLSGFSWPRSNISPFWLAFSWIFPAVHGIQGYIKINTMGAGIHQLNLEVVSLWVQAGFYFITTLIVYRLQIRNSKSRAQAEQEGQDDFTNDIITE